MSSDGHFHQQLERIPVLYFPAVAVVAELDAPAMRAAEIFGLDDSHSRVYAAYAYARGLVGLCSCESALDQVVTAREMPEDRTFRMRMYLPR